MTPEDTVGAPWRAFGEGRFADARPLLADVSAAARRTRRGGWVISVAGTGRGKAGPEIAQALAHGARLALHSTPGVGAVATVSFPPAA